MISQFFDLATLISWCVLLHKKFYHDRRFQKLLNTIMSAQLLINKHKYTIYTIYTSSSLL